MFSKESFLTKFLVVVVVLVVLVVLVLPILLAAAQPTKIETILHRPLMKY